MNYTLKRAYRTSRRVLRALWPIATSLCICWAIVTFSPAVAQPISLEAMEVDLENDFETYFGRELASFEHDVSEIAEIMHDLGHQTDTRDMT